MVDLSKIPQHPSPDMGGPLSAPRFVVLHYTASTTLDGAVREMIKKDARYASAHYCIDPGGQNIVQLVPTNHIAYHAGESAYKGLTGLNKYSIGIELTNPGYLVTLDPNWPHVTLTHKHERMPREWAVYSHGQIEAAQALVAALASKFTTLTEVVGHDDIAPKRKLDVGPAWPIALPCSIQAFVTSPLRGP